MRINRVRVQGFRCLEDVDVPFGDVTTLIGPNGVGKSSLLRALDWFFNGSASAGISHEDLSANALNGRVRVEVEFTQLTTTDREQLGRYAPDAVQTVLLRRTWTDEAEVFSGNARVYPAFAGIRAVSGAMEKRTLYSELRSAHPELELPAASSVAKVDEAIAAWENDHPHDLADSEVETSTRFFGFLGGAKLSGLFDYVFVSADLRADDEVQDSRTATVGRLLERTIDRQVVTTEIDALIGGLNERQARLVEEHLSDQLATLGTDLTETVSQFTTGREVRLEVMPASVRVQPLQFATRVADGDVLTLVSGQGHGFQRALLIAALKMVAERGRQDPTSGTILLAIEEPELYQHPAQARAFAETLRALAENPDQAVQAVYATHSPLFIEPGKFHQLRRLRRVNTTGGTRTTIVAAERRHVVEALDGIMSEDKALRQIDKACPQRLAEAVFSDAVVLVEGETDKAVLDSVAVRDGGVAARNISVIDVSGKDSLPLCGAILTSLGIPVVLVADNDVDHRIDPLEEATDNLSKSEARARRSNRRLLKAVGLPEVDWPSGGLHGEALVFFEPNLETWLRENWPEWEIARQRLIDEEVGYADKHARTYFNAATDATSDPPPDLRLILETVTAKVASA
jgi:energy-coupling factor transporter ATP-binding protein EcfA2